MRSRTGWWVWHGEWLGLSENCRAKCPVRRWVLCRVTMTNEDKAAPCIDMGRPTRMRGCHVPVLCLGSRLGAAGGKQ
jgi:hypothetical protein